MGDELMFYREGIAQKRVGAENILVKRRHWSLLLVSVGLAVACTADDSGDGMNAGAGGLGGGAAGQAGASMGDDWRHQVDLTLGGFNGDLPEPAFDCTSDAVPGTACLSFSGMVGEEMIDDMGSCQRPDSIGARMQYTVSCDFSTAESRRVVSTWVPSMAVTAIPGTFAWMQTTPSPVDTSFGRRLRDDAVHIRWGDQFLNAGSPNLIEARVYGWIIETTDMWDPALKHHEVRGAFAATWSPPQPGCEDPVTPGGACGEGRIRGNFLLRLPQRNQ